MDERSIYRKMQVALDEARRGRHHSLDELVVHIERRSPLNFVYSMMDKQRGHRISSCSERSIKNTVELCAELGLLDSKSGRLSSTGSLASDTSQFGKVLGKQLVDYFDRAKIPISNIKTAISERLLRHNPPLPPTVDNICAALGEPIPLVKFAQLMHLLGLCGIFETSQRRMYFPKR